MSNFDDFVECLKEEMAKASVTQIPNPQLTAQSFVENLVENHNSIGNSLTTNWDDDCLHIFLPDGSICQKFDDNFETLDVYSGE